MNWIRKHLAPGMPVDLMVADDGEPETWERGVIVSVEQLTEDETMLVVRPASGEPDREWYVFDDSTDVRLYF